MQSKKRPGVIVEEIVNEEHSAARSLRHTQLADL
jgi:hypothetical protein